MDRMKAESDESTEATVEAANDLAAILRCQPPLLAYWDADLRNRFVSDGYSSWYGTDSDSMLGMSIHDVPGPESHERGMPHVLAVISGERQQFDLATVNGDGKLTSGRATYTPHVSGGAVHGFFCVVTDESSRVLPELAPLTSLDACTPARERESVAAELHHEVVGSLLSIGLDLASVASIAPPAVTARLSSTLDHLDEALAVLREEIVRLTRDAP